MSAERTEADSRTTTNVSTDVNDQTTFGPVDEFVQVKRATERGVQIPPTPRMKHDALHDDLLAMNTSGGRRHEAPTAELVG